MEVTLDYINRSKRLWTRVLQVVILGLLAFSLAAIYVKYEGEGTLLEDLFGFERYWRTIGWVGLPVSFVLYLFIDHLIKYKRGKVLLSEDKIVLTEKHRRGTFHTSQIDSMRVIKDLPYEGDERTDTQKASRLIFYMDNRRYDLELSTPHKADIDNLRPVLHHWKHVLKDYKETNR